MTTVRELQERLEEQSGIVPSKQGKILHQGKRVNNDVSLTEAGVVEGDQLNCVPAKKSSSSSGSKKKSSSTTRSSSAPSTVASAGAAAGSGGGETNSLADMMKGLGLDGSDIAGGAGGGGLDDMISKMMSGGMGGGPGGDGSGMPDMAESMKMMKELTSSPLFSEYMNDPEKLEEARQMILQNPMMKGMMMSMPGMSEILGDKEMWAQAMTAAAGIMQSMDPEDMIKMMEMQGGAGGMGMGGGMGGGGMPPGMGGDFFDMGTSSSALDELSEGED